MREIRFRAWDKKKKKMFYLGDDSEDPYLELYTDNWYLCGTSSEDEGNVLMQFTGLKDRKGKEVYEGDIISWLADGIIKNAIIIWKFNGYVAKRIGLDINGMEYEFQSFIPIVKDKFEGRVIGNSYETPELLETSQKQRKAK